MDTINYDEFRTGLTFTEVRRMLMYEQRRAKEKGYYVFVTRRTVLGRWHQLKQQMYKEIENGQNKDIQ